MLEQILSWFQLQQFRRWGRGFSKAGLCQVVAKRGNPSPSESNDKIPIDSHTQCTSYWSLDVGKSSKGFICSLPALRLQHKAATNECLYTLNKKTVGWKNYEAEQLEGERYYFSNTIFFLMAFNWMCFASVAIFQPAHSIVLVFKWNRNERSTEMCRASFSKNYNLLNPS